MAKALLKTGSGLEQAKSINIYRDGAWQNQKMGYVYVNGVWVPLMEYKKWIYEAGTEHMPLIVGFTSYQSIDFIKEDSYLNIYHFRSPGTAYFSVENKVDVTDYSKAFIEWSSELEGDSFLIFSNDIGIAPNRLDAVARLDMYEGFGKTISSLDISDLKGEFYISAGIRISATLKGLSLYIYNIWLE